MLSLDSQSCKRLLEQKLPGEAAQSIMAPSSRQMDMHLHERDKARDSSVMILLAKKDSHLLFPLIKRPEYDGQHSGQISLPGGKSEPNDKSALHTAMRETEEELGICPDSIEIIGCLSPLYIPVSNFNVQPFIGWWHEPSAYNPDPREVERIIEMPLLHLMSQDNTNKFREVINGREIIAPYFKLNNDIIWGATAMILSELKQLLTAPLTV